MKPILPLLMIMLLFLLSCAGSHSAGVASDAAPKATTTANAVSTLTVKVTRNDVTLANYQSGGGGAVLDEGTLFIELASPDSKHALTIDVPEARVGTWPLSVMAEKGKAVINFTSDTLPLPLSPEKGELQLTEATATSLSGSFTGTRVNDDGTRFTLTGTFLQLRVRKV